jgi:dihydrofolate synthase/folylpolyglutamate synthase
MVTEDAASDRITATVRTPRGTYAALHVALAGRHQIDNAAVAIRLLEELPTVTGFHLPPIAIRAAVELVTWPARLEWRRWRGGRVLIDGAHNPAGARALAAYASGVIPHRTPVIVGIMRDKAGDGMLAALAPIASCFVCTAAGSPRALPPADLGDLARQVAPDVPVVVAADAEAALQAAALRGEPVIVAGSLYLAGEMRRKLS